MKSAIIKWNNGNLAILCSKCSVIIKTGIEFTQEELDIFSGKINKNLKPYYCDKCKTTA